MAVKLFTFLGVIAAVAIMATAAADSPAQAQQPNDSPPPLVDLSIASEPRDSGSGREVWDIIVRNNLVADFPGTTAATVKVRVVINDGINAPVTEVHTIRDVPAGDEATLSFRFPSPKAMDCGSAPVQPVLSRIHAEIIETDPLEPTEFRFNNATENVGMFCGSAAFVNGDTGVEVGVSNRSPQPGGTTTFTVIAQNHVGPAVDSRRDHNDDQFDVQVKISLTPGLSFGTTTDTTFSTTTGIWNVGELTTTLSGISKSLPVAVNLTADSLAEIPLEKRCLTAEVVSAKPWFAWDYSKRLNDTYTACLGKILVRLNQGNVDLFHYLDCVGSTTAPCTSADTLELVAKMSLGFITPGNLYAQPDELLVHISDPEGRHGSTRSVFRGTIWSTGTAFRHQSSAPQIEGIGVSFEFLPGSTWTAYRWMISDVSPKQRPGAVKIIHRFQGDRLLLDADAQTSLGPVFNNGTSIGEYPVFVTFGTLGTYKIKLTVGATKSSTQYTATGTYTFYVGPMADLEVRDAGASPAVAAGRSGYTVMALNNGPDIPPAVRVTLSGVPEGAEPVISHGHGTYTQGTCQNSLCAGVWAAGELGRGDYRASGHANEGPTLTLITDEAMPADITATIENTQDYSVCIDSGGDDVAINTPSETACTATSGNTWHSTAYYDHISKNNTATITAGDGSGDGLPDAPAGVQVTETPVANIFVWQPVATVNGHEVTHYEVQRSASPWETLDSDVKETVYVDTASGTDDPDYRVRAVNIFGVPGSWSAAAMLSLKPGRPKSFTANGQSDTVAGLSWSMPDNVVGVTITGYDLEFSKDGGVTWTALAAPATLGQSATSYTHTDATLTSASLSPDILRQYRARTVGTIDSSTVKSDWATATLAHPKPNGPVTFAAAGQSETQASLSWSAPAAVTHVSITGYEVEFSKDGGANWDTVTGTPTATQTQSGTDYTLTHSDSGLAADAVRQYRTRTLGTVGSVTVYSDWVYALASEDYPAPGAPRNFAARAINRSRVDLSWSAPVAVDGVAHTGYHLEFSSDGNTWNWLPVGQTRTVLSATTTRHEHIDNMLEPGALRQYRLRAVGTANNAIFESGWVFASAATEAVGPPLNLYATHDPESPAASKTRINLTWDEPAFGADRVTGYRIDRAPDGSKDWQTLEHSHAGRSYQHTGRRPGERSCYRVAAIFAGGTGPFSAPVCATTLGAPADDLPGAPEGLRIDSVGSNYVVLEWDAPSLGGAVDYYEYRSHAHAPTQVPGASTKVTVRSLQPGTSYEFQVRAVNNIGEGSWSRPIQFTLNRAGGAVKATPTELEVAKGSTGRFRVSLNRNPQWPLALYTHWEGPDCLTDSLPYQQGKILLPGNPPPSKAFWDDGWWGPPEDRFAEPWNVGLEIEMDASECQGGETAVVEYSLHSLPFSALEGVPMWEELGLNEEEWREKWSVDPLDGISGPSVKVTVVDGAGTRRAPSGEQGLASVNAGATAVNVSVNLPPQAAVWRREERGLYGSQPAWDWWD